MSNAPPMTTRPKSVSLRELFPSALFVDCDDLAVTTVTDRSGECQPGVLFAAISGHRQNGAEFISAAVRLGAGAVLVEHRVPQLTVPQCIVPHVREAYARIGAGIGGNPSQVVEVLGVSGTNGKTTVTWLIRAMLRCAGYRTGLLGTIDYDDGVTSAPSELTTPDSWSFPNG